MHANFKVRELARYAGREHCIGSDLFILVHPSKLAIHHGA